MSDYIQKIRSLNEVFLANNGRYPSMFIQTFGCQMNDRESEKLYGQLLAMGYSESPSEKEADLVLYNTCCVRGKAEERVFGRLGSLKSAKRKNPNKLIVMCGCMPQREEVITEVKRSHKHIDVVFGTFNKHHFPKLLLERFNTGKQVIEILQEHSETSAEEFDGQVSRFSPHKAGVTVMHGCDNYCSYCIVPYVRGREKSRPIEEVVTEIEALAADGVKEVMLLGQNVNSYAYGFPELLAKVNQVSGIKRIRFVTSHPKDLSASLVTAMRDYDKVCKHMHLPIQSGSTSILNAMNRGYTQKEYLKLTEYLRKAIPEIAITTDIIVGFPGETDSDFEDTLEVVRQAMFCGAYTFLYSPREGTPAAKLTDLVPDKLIHERFNRLVDLVNSQQLAYNKSLIGKTVEVMVDGETEGEAGKYTGRGDDNTLVHFDIKSKPNPGDIIKVEVSSCKTFYVSGQAKAGVKQ